MHTSCKKRLAAASCRLKIDDIYIKLHDFLAVVNKVAHRIKYNIYSLKFIKIGRFYMNNKAIQDLYPDKYSLCYGCGRLNENGLKIKTYWNGREGVCSFYPERDHLSLPGFVYGGLIASLIDCNSTATAAAAAYQAEGREFGSKPDIRFVTASLHVDYLKPAPIEGPLELRSYVKEVRERRIIITTELKAGNVLCAKGEVAAAGIPAAMEQAK